MRYRTVGEANHRPILPSPFGSIGVVAVGAEAYIEFRNSPYLKTGPRFSLAALRWRVNARLPVNGCMIASISAADSGGSPFSGMVEDKAAFRLAVSIWPESSSSNAARASRSSDWDEALARGPARADRYPARFISLTPGGKKCDRTAGEDSIPSWPSISATSAEVITPLLDRSRTVKDSRMVCSWAGGIDASGSAMEDWSLSGDAIWCLEVELEPRRSGVEGFEAIPGGLKDGRGTDEKEDCRSVFLEDSDSTDGLFGLEPPPLDGLSSGLGSRRGLPRVGDPVTPGENEREFEPESLRGEAEGECGAVRESGLEAGEFGRWNGEFRLGFWLWRFWRKERFDLNGRGEEDCCWPSRRS